MRKLLRGALLALALTWGCGGGGSSGSSSTTLSVSVSPKTATVSVSATQQFTATVSNDSSSRGVTWSLTQAGINCSPSCGTISPATTASGTATTYTAPTTVVGASSVTITATAVADTTHSASATITLNTIGISITPSSATVSVGATQQFTAKVANDPSNKGVNWSLAQNGTSCSPGCGTVSPTSTPSGTATTYTAPGSVPNPAQVTITATSVADPNQFTSAAITVQSVTVSPATANVAVNGTQAFTVTLASTLAAGGATWSLSQNGVACSSGCGSVSPTNTANNASTTYTAPSSAPNPPTVTITATSVTDPKQSATATITVEGVTVSVSPTFANVAVNGTQKFTATVANDVSNKGVSWQLTQSGSACSPTCGSISATSSASGAAITYTAPKSPMTVTLTATSVADTSQAVSATIVVQAISVIVTPTSATVPAGLTEQFIATVSNDVNNSGVNWKLTQGGSACGSACGTLSATGTASGAPVTYTAPATVPSPATVTLTATSNTDSTKTASATITVGPAIAISVAPTSATVVVGTSKSFTATVANDPANAGAFWTLTQGGSNCAPGCGTVAPGSTASGAATAYTAPTTVPSPATVTLTAFSTTDISKSATAQITVSSSAALATFSGTFAFLFNGSDASGAVAMAGTITADGAGNLTGGLADINRASGLTTAQGLTGSYSVGADGRGSFTLASSPEGTALGTFRFALNAAGSQAQFIESDASGTRGAGVIEKQTPAALAGTALAGDYAFGLTGADPGGNRFALAGRFHADPAGTVTAGMYDANDAGAIAAGVPFAGAYTLTPAGRGTLTTMTPSGALDWAVYVVSPGEAFLVSTDARTTAPLTSGKILAQTPGAAGGFSAAALHGTSVIRFAGISRAGSAATVGAGLARFDGGGALALAMDENVAGRVGSLRGNGAYAVAPNGRATIALTGSNDFFAAYLASANEAFFVGTGSDVLAGFFEPQTPGPFGTSSFSGKFIAGTALAPASGSALETGVVSYSGAGRLVGTADRAIAGHASVSDLALADSYSVAANGRVSTGNGAVALYIVSPSQAVAIDLAPGKTTATISTVEK